MKALATEVGASYLAVEEFLKKNIVVEEAIGTGDCGEHLRRRLMFSGDNEAIQTLEIRTLVVADFEPCWMKPMGAASSASEPPGAT